MELQNEERKEPLASDFFTRNNSNECVIASFKQRVSKSNNQKVDETSGGTTIQDCIDAIAPLAYCSRGN